MKRISFVLLTVLLMGAARHLWLATARAAPTLQQPTCLFFTETAGGQGRFSVCDEASANFRSAFEQWGLQKIGYPISQRYNRDGFVTQAFQKAIMQWRPDSNSVALVNIFDDLHNAGFDTRLLETRQTPTQLPPAWDGDLSFGEVIVKRQALLDARPALRQTYFASTDPLTFYGLPTSTVQDMGNHYAIRLQRAVLQEWKEHVPWARAGEVTIANGGDIAKELGALPPAALIPEGGISTAHSPTAVPQATVPLAATSTPISPPSATSPPIPPSVPVTRSGGEWDFDGGYTLWHNPYGEPCTGGSLANGWNAFLTEGQFGSSCFNENKFGPNIQSGNRSQEITFESIDATAGLWRPFETVPGKRYRVSAWGIWHESPSPVILELGIDQSAGQSWNAPTVQWTPWNKPSPGTWHQMSVEFVASGTQTTLFLKGSHPIGPTSDPHPLRGGATLFDNASVTELGPG